MHNNNNLINNLFIGICWWYWLVMDIVEFIKIILCMSVKYMTILLLDAFSIKNCISDKVCTAGCGCTSKIFLVQLCQYA